MEFNRRKFIQYGLGTLAAVNFKKGWASNSSGPHYILTIMLSGGTDDSYMFDARPLALTQAGKIQNYAGLEPELWTGHNGTSTLVSPLMAPLKSFKDDFSIVNGIVMSSSFDGHEQNANIFFTNNPFGGESFVPVLNKDRFPIDAVAEGFLPINISNGSSIVPFDANSAEKLIPFAQNYLSKTQENNLLRNYILKRYETLGREVKGKFSNSNKALYSAFSQSPSLAEKISKLSLSSNGENDFIATVAAFFRANISKAGVYGKDNFTVLDSNLRFDTHDSDSAKRQPELYKAVGEFIAQSMKTLKETPFNSQQSLLDVTTVVIGSEFARTMRQIDFKIDDTGTDHNSLNNSVLLAGKGIKGGLILGESDYRTADEVLSPLHKSLDASEVKTMGKPFDFAAFKPRNDLPTTFKADEHITMANVVNTIHKVFDSESSKYWVTERNGAVAKVLSPLLS